MLPRCCGNNVYVCLFIHLKSVLPQCCVNTHRISTHRKPCYHSDVATTFLTVYTLKIFAAIVLPQCCVNKVSYSFSTHINPCYHSAVAITFLTVSIHLKSFLPHCCGNKVSYSFSTHISPCYHSAVAITSLTVYTLKICAAIVLCQ